MNEDEGHWLYPAEPEAQRVALTVRCPVCGSDPGLGCRTDTDCPVWAHADRIKLATKEQP